MKDMKPKRRAGERIIRRASSLRHSQRSVGRSGYAFSHQEGFAELITSGSIMKPQNVVAVRNTNSAVSDAANSTTSNSLYVDSSFVTASVNTAYLNDIEHTSGDIERTPVPV
jgi:hypothetical protein